MTAAAGATRALVLVSGGGSNLQALIDRNRDGALGIELAGVVSDRPGVFALERAARAGIPAAVVDFAASGSRERFASALKRTIDTLAPDLIILAGFMRILPAGLVNAHLGRMLNIHPSLLPLYPGLDTYRRALAAGDAWHGSTVHFVTPELDAGPAIIQFRVAIGPDDTVDSLRERVQRGEHRIYPDAVSWLASGRLALREGRSWLDGRPLAAPVQVLETVAARRVSS
jgi:phosphoribosylglycinamide formyltransferase-1